MPGRRGALGCRGCGTRPATSRALGAGHEGNRRAWRASRGLPCLYIQARGRGTHPEASRAWPAGREGAAEGAGHNMSRTLPCLGDGERRERRAWGASRSLPCLRIQERRDPAAAGRIPRPPVPGRQGARGCRGCGTRPEATRALGAEHERGRRAWRASRGLPCLHVQAPRDPAAVGRILRPCLAGGARLVAEGAGHVPWPPVPWGRVAEGYGRSRMHGEASCASRVGRRGVPTAKTHGEANTDPQCARCQWDFTGDL